MPRTLMDVITTGEAGPFESRMVEIPHSTHPHFRCRCGRITPADMMLEVQPEGCEGVGSELCGHDRFRCDGCWRRWLLRRDLTVDEFRARTGQPPAPEGVLW